MSFEKVNPPRNVRWSKLLCSVNVSESQANQAFLEIEQAYQQPERYYHNLTHLDDMFQVVDQLAQSSVSPALLLAIWYHDVVYDSKKNDNEEQSASLAESRLRQWDLDQAILDETIRLILLTKVHHAEPKDHEGHILLDADLAILSSEADRYHQYSQAIRKEYSWVSDAEYRAGRSKVLQRFLERDSLYFTAKFQADREEQARRNLAHELDQLASIE